MQQLIIDNAGSISSSVVPRSGTAWIANRRHCQLLPFVAEELKKQNML